MTTRRTLYSCGNGLVGFGCYRLLTTEPTKGIGFWTTDKPLSVTEERLSDIEKPFSVIEKRLSDVEERSLDAEERLSVSEKPNSETNKVK